MSSKMKALVKKERAPGLWMEEVPIPKIKEHEVLIKVRKNAICGTDMHIYKWDQWSQNRVPTPMVIGHEFMGEIAEVGSSVKNLKVGSLKIGQRVSGEGHLTCGLCINCLSEKRHLCPNTLGIGYDCSGNFAEYFTLPAVNLFPLPDTISDNLAAIFDPFGNAVHTALTFPLAGEDVLITGAGPIGIMACAIAKHSGSSHVVITDLNDYRLGLAKKMGATAAINVQNSDLKEEIEKLGIKEGFTVGFEMSGDARGLNALLEMMRPGGKVALLGVLPPGTAIENWDHVIFRMLTLEGISGREIFSTWFKMLSLLEGGLNIEPVITHQFPIDEFQQAFDVMASGNSGKILLNW